jgi:hypothetical protein
MIRSLLPLVVSLVAIAGPALAQESGGNREPAGGAFNSSIPPKTRPDAPPTSAAAPSDQTRHDRTHQPTSGDPVPSQAAPNRR